VTDAVPALISYVDAEGRYQFNNRGYHDWFGHTPEELRGKHLREVLGEVAFERVRPQMEAVLSGTRVQFEGDIPYQDGGTRHIHADYVPDIRANGAVAGFYALVTDISDRKLAEAALREREQELTSMFQVSSVGMAHSDPESRRFTRVNAALCKITGYSESELLAMTVDQLNHPDDQERDREVYTRRSKDGAAYVIEKRYLRKDGTSVWVQVAGDIIRGTGGRPIRAFALVQDITERRRAEAGMRAAERMDAVGRLAGGVAHEANNQMTVVLGCADFALRLPDLSPDARTELLSIQQAAERTAAVTAQLLAFGRQQVLRPSPVDLNATIEAFAPVLRRTLGETSVLVLDLSPRLSPVLADQGQIEQVLINLAFNARDAMPGGGHLTVATDAVTLAEAESGSDPSDPLRPGRYASVLVSDTGQGMNRSTLELAFEPFFTTKPVGEGTGLGLSTVYGIVRQLGGDITVESAPGAGTTFRIYLPFAELSQARLKPAAEPVPAPRGVAATVLVVEDEPQVRALAVRALKANGFRVLQAEHGKAALELLGRELGAVQAVVSDIAMPVMGGYALAEHVARAYPGLPVLLTTGHASDELVRRGMTATKSLPMLQKPFSPDSLVTAVRALMKTALVEGDGYIAMQQTGG
jgi:two-component system, cell cycle sensor histidine kinase and response regulator CckA